MTSITAPLIAPHDAALPTRAPADVSSSRTRAALSIASIVALTLAAGLPGLGDWCRLTPDSFTYLNAARCLRETGGYAPLRMIVPPGFPTLLAPLLTWGELPLLAVRMMNLVCWIASAVLTYLVFRRQLGTSGAWLTAVLIATSPAMSAQSAALLSEAAFTPLIMGCLLLMEMPRDSASSRWTTPIALGLLCAAATLVRTMGIVLAPVLAMALLVRSGASLRRRALHTVLFASVFATPLIAWQIRQSHYPRGNSYGRAWLSARPNESTKSEGLALQVERLTRFGPMRLRDIHVALVPPRLGWRSFHGPTATIAGWVIGGGMVLLTLWRCWRTRSPIDFYALATLAMLCLWPYDEGARMVTPLLPIFFASIIWAAQRAQSALAARPRASMLVTLGLAGLLVAHLCEFVIAHPSLAAQRDKTASRVAAMQHIRAWQDAKLPKDAALACVTRPRDEAKTIFIGGSYLARRRIVQTLEDVGAVADDALIPEVRFCFVHSESLAHPEISNGWSPLGRVEGFEVYSLEGRSR